MKQKADYSEKRYWPFEALPAEKQTGQQEAEVRFLDAAYREGYRPYVAGPDTEFGAHGDERWGLILVRGRKQWEIILGTLDAKNVSAFVNDFHCAAEAVLGWLRGSGSGDVLSTIAGHLLLLPGASHSFVLHEPAKK